MANRPTWNPALIRPFVATLTIQDTPRHEEQ